MSSEDIAMTQRLPSGDYPNSNKSSCTYVLYERHWKPEEGWAYDNNSSLDIVAKVDFIINCFSDILVYPHGHAYRQAYMFCLCFFYVFFLNF